MCRGPLFSLALRARENTHEIYESRLHPRQWEARPFARSPMPCARVHSRRLLSLWLALLSRLSKRAI